MTLTLPSISLSTLTTMEATTDTNKRIPKLTERAKAAVEDRHDVLKKRKNDSGDNNVSKKGRTDPKISRDKNSNGEASTSSQQKPSRRVTVEEVPDEDDGFISQRNSDNDESRTTTQEVPTSQPCTEDEPGVLDHHAYSVSLHSKLAVRNGERNSPIYAFFENPKVIQQGGRSAHEFKCSRRGCATRVRRYLDTKDAGSTGNLRKHARSCWGTAAVNAADSAANADEVRKVIIPNILKDGSISVAFKLKKGTATYSHHQHTHEETK